MGIQKSPRIHGAVRVRAETGDANAILADLNRAFAAFKDEHQAEISSINARFADVVQAEKVERINAEMAAWMRGERGPDGKFAVPPFEAVG